MEEEAAINYVVNLTTSEQRRAATAIPRAELLAAVRALAGCQRCGFVEQVIAAFDPSTSVLLASSSAYSSSSFTAPGVMAPAQLLALLSAQGGSSDLVGLLQFAWKDAAAPHTSHSSSATSTGNKNSGGGGRTRSESADGEQGSSSSSSFSDGAAHPFSFPVGGEDSSSSAASSGGSGGSGSGSWSSPDGGGGGGWLCLSESLLSKPRLLRRFLTESRAAMQALSDDVGDCRRHAGYPGPSELASTLARLHTQRRHTLERLAAWGALGGGSSSSGAQLGQKAQEHQPSQLLLAPQQQPARNGTAGAGDVDEREELNGDGSSGVSSGVQVEAGQQGEGYGDGDPQLELAIRLSLHESGHGVPASSTAGSAPAVVAAAASASSAGAPFPLDLGSWAAGTSAPRAAAVGAGAAGAGAGAPDAGAAAPLVDTAAVAALPEGPRERVQHLVGQLAQVEQRLGRLQHACQFGLLAGGRKLLLLLLQLMWAALRRHHRTAVATGTVLPAAAMLDGTDAAGAAAGQAMAAPQPHAAERVISPPPGQRHPQQQQHPRASLHASLIRDDRQQPPQPPQLQSLHASPAGRRQQSQRSPALVEGRRQEQQQQGAQPPVHSPPGGGLQEGRRRRRYEGLLADLAAGLSDEDSDEEGMEPHLAASLLAADPQAAPRFAAAATAARRDGELGRPGREPGLQRLQRTVEASEHWDGGDWDAALRVPVNGGSGAVRTPHGSALRSPSGRSSREEAVHATSTVLPRQNCVRLSSPVPTTPSTSLHPSASTSEQQGVMGSGYSAGNGNGSGSGQHQDERGDRGGRGVRDCRAVREAQAEQLVRLQAQLSRCQASETELRGEVGRLLDLLAQSRRVQEQAVSSLQSDLAQWRGEAGALAGLGAEELGRLAADMEAALGRVRAAQLQAAATRDLQCPVCWERRKGLVFGCGHQTCGPCGDQLSTCPICRLPISLRIRVYS